MQIRWVQRDLLLLQTLLLKTQTFKLANVRNISESSQVSRHVGLFWNPQADTEDSPTFVQSGVPGSVCAVNVESNILHHLVHAHRATDAGKQCSSSSKKTSLVIHHYALTHLCRQQCVCYSYRYCAGFLAEVTNCSFNSTVKILHCNWKSCILTLG